MALLSSSLTLRLPRFSPFSLPAVSQPLHHHPTLHSELSRKIIRGQVNLPSDLSLESKDLVLRMLHTDPKKRITLPEVMIHSWMQMACTRKLYVVPKFTEQMDGDVLDQMNQMGFNTGYVQKTLGRREFNLATTTYRQLWLARLQAKGPSGGSISN